jgi:hypothetical protein
MRAPHPPPHPIRYLLTGGAHCPTCGAETANLIIQKEGKGRLYYRLGLRYLSFGPLLCATCPPAGY